MTADKTWDEATTHLDDHGATTQDPAHDGIYADITYQPFSGNGFVFAQVGWLDNEGNAYGLRHPSNLPRPGVTLRALYVGLGAHDTAADAEPDGQPPLWTDEVEPCA